MNKDKAQQIVTAFPRLFRERSFFECRDGWFQLIYQLAADIEQAARDAGLDQQSEDWPCAIQVKEKFGTLRFYVDTPSAPKPEGAGGLGLDGSPGPANFLAFRPVAGIKEIRDLVATAEAKSESICEECGAPGTLIAGDGWWRVRCELCEARGKKGFK